jgi:tetratricopeptide (TPR) repeat protein
VFTGQYAEARIFWKTSIKRSSVTTVGSRSRCSLGLASLGLGDRAKARGHYVEALALAQRLGNKLELAGAQNALAQLYRVEGELDVAEPLYESVVALARELGNDEIVAIGLLNLAMVSIGRGATDRTRTLLLDVLPIAERIGSKPVAQSVLEVSAGLAAARGEHGRAARFFGAAEAQTAQTGLHRDPADEAFLRPLIAQVRAALGETAFAAAATSASAGRRQKKRCRGARLVGRAPS